MLDYTATFLIASVSFLSETMVYTGFNGIDYTLCFFVHVTAMSQINMLYTDSMRFT